MGVAGAGKSTLAHAIMRGVRAVYLDNNHIADAFFPNTRNGPRYERLRPKLYKALYKIAEENLKRGNSVVLDVPHIKEVQTREWQDFIKNLAKKNRAKLIAIRCLCSEKILRARLRRRAEQRDKWKLKQWEKFLAQQPIDVPIPFPHLNVDTERSLERNATASIRYIKNNALNKAVRQVASKSDVP